jgi:ligand-binding sensor domain-containing protein
MRDLIEDAYGNIWVATHEAGLARVDTKGDVQYWDTQNSNIGNNNIFDLHLSSNQTLWIGT